MITLSELKDKIKMNRRNLILEENFKEPNYFIKVENFKRFSVEFFINEYNPKKAMFSLGCIWCEDQDIKEKEFIPQQTDKILGAIFLPTTSRMFTKIHSEVEEVFQNKIELDKIKSIKVKSF